MTPRRRPDALGTSLGTLAGTLPATPPPALLLAVACLLLPAAPTAAQDDTLRTASELPALQPPSTGGWGAVSVIPRPGTTVATVTVALPVGSSSDPEGREGTAALLAESIRRDVLVSLSPTVRAATDVAAETGRERTVLRLATLPEHWEEAYGLLARSLFEMVPSPGALEAARQERMEVFTFESDSPVRQFQRELYRTLAGAGSPWSRPVRGTPSTVEALTVTDLADFRADHYRKGRAAVAVTGRVDPDAAARRVAGGPLPPSGVAVASSLAPTRPDAPAWAAGSRERLEREVTSSWITVAYPVAPELEWTPLELLVHRLRAAFETDPPDPGLFHASVGVETLDGAPILLIEVAVLPEATEGWERRIVETVDELRGEVLDAPFFRWHRRRFRSAQLLDEAAPEALGLRVAGDLLRGGEGRDLEARIWALDGRTLQAAARALGEPRIVVFGPSLAEPSDR